MYFRKCIFRSKKFHYRYSSRCCLMTVLDILFENVSSAAYVGLDDKIISANMSCKGYMPFSYRASLIIYPPLAVSLVKTQACRSSIVAAIPRGSCSSKYSTWRCGATVPRKLLTRLRRTSNGSIRFEYAFLVRRVSEVTPQ